ncbi:unnamed protein product, partial [Brenthis ino]
MIGKLSIVLSVLAVSRALPILVYENDMPAFIWRTARAPNVAFGFGSGFSSNIGGISQSNSIGASFQSGDADAYGAGIASDGNLAQGIGYARASPYHQILPLGLHQSSSSAFSNSFGRNYGSAISSAQNFGNSGLSLSSAQNHNGFGTAVSAVQNNGIGNYQTAASQAYNGRSGFDSAVSSASSHGLGYGVAQSAAQNIGGYGSALSLSQNQGLNNFGTAISASNNNGGFGSSIAQTTQQHGRHLQQSGASSINGPGIQASQSHAINNGYY